MEKSADIFIKERSELSMSAVSEVLEFDSDFIAVMTPHGKVEIEGKDMKILNMSSDTGDLTVLGTVNGVYYSAKPEGKKGIFSRGTK